MHERLSPRKDLKVKQTLIFFFWVDVFTIRLLGCDLQGQSSSAAEEPFFFFFVRVGLVPVRSEIVKCLNTEIRLGTIPNGLGKASGFLIRLSVKSLLY